MSVVGTILEAPHTDNYRLTDSKDVIAKLIDEKNQLITKVSKARSFLRSRASNKISNEMLGLIVVQLTIMDSYISVLQRRIELL